MPSGQDDGRGDNDGDDGGDGDKSKDEDDDEVKGEDETDEVGFKGEAEKKTKGEAKGDGSGAGKGKSVDDHEHEGARRQAEELREIISDDVKPTPLLARGLPNGPTRALQLHSSKPRADTITNKVESYIRLLDSNQGEKLKKLAHDCLNLVAARRHTVEIHDHKKHEFNGKSGEFKPGYKPPRGQIARSLSPLSNTFMHNSNTVHTYR